MACTSAMALGFGLAAPAMAQDEAADADLGGFSGDPIVVTATKREETLQEVPVAVSVTSAATIEQANIRDLKDLSSVVPSLRVNTLQSSANTNFVIRGFGNGANNAGIEPSVGLFIDGVYRSRSAAMIADLPDVERVEVLRGPQSTLFGKNASAGVISMTTKKPQFDFGGMVEGSYGNYNAMVLKGVVTGPISDTLAVSLAGSMNKRDGYTRDLALGIDADDRDRWMVRAQVLAEPSDAISVRLIGDYGEIDEICCSVVNIRQSASTLAIIAPPPFGLGGQVNPASDPFGDVTYTNLPSSNDVKNWGISGQVDFEVGAATITSITSYRGVEALTNQDSDFTSADLLGRNSQDLDIKTFTQELRVNAELGDRANLLLGGYYFNERIDQRNQLLYGADFRNYADLLIRGQSGGAFNLLQVEGLLGTLSGNPALFAGRSFAQGDGFTEAYDLKNDSLSIFGQVDFEVSDRLTLTAGIAWTKDKKTFRTNSVSTDVFSAIPLSQFVAPATNVFIAQGVATALGNPGGFATPEQIQAFASGALGPQAAAAFQNVIVPTATSTAQSLLALRGLQFLPPFLNVPNAVESGKVSDDDFSYTLSLAYEFTDSLNGYIRYATGYKGASVNLSRDSRPSPTDFAAIQAAGLGLPNLTSGSRFAGPEDSTLYEIGLKGDWGPYASANLAIFKQEIKGFQSNLFTGTGFFLANAGKQSVTGFEFEGMVRPVDPLTLTLGVTYLDAKYDSFLLSAFGDLSGTTPAGFTPLSATFGATYEHEFASGDRLILRGDYHYEAPFQAVEGLPNLVVKNPVTGQVLDVEPALSAARAFDIEVSEINASLTYAMMNGLEVSVWGRNLTNDRVLRSIFDSPAQIGSLSGYPSQPRTYGITARFKW
ncbi:MAG: TonB-dependent receptor [Sphingomonadaceae bacterium]